VSPPLTWRRQLRDAELEPFQDVDLPAVSQWTGGPALATKAATVGLWAMLLAGPAGLLVGGVALVSVAQPASRDAVTSVDQSRDRAAAGEFAQRLVVTWLTSSRGQETNLVSPGQHQWRPRLWVRASNSATNSRSTPQVRSRRPWPSSWAPTLPARVTSPGMYRHRRRSPPCSRRHTRP